MWILFVDVMDVAWSPHDIWLASCSVDNTIVIWNARKFPGNQRSPNDLWKSVDESLNQSKHA